MLHARLLRFYALILICILSPQASLRDSTNVTASLHPATYSDLSRKYAPQLTATIDVSGSSENNNSPNRVALLDSLVDAESGHCSRNCGKLLVFQYSDVVSTGVKWGGGKTDKRALVAQSCVSYVLSEN